MNIKVKEKVKDNEMSIYKVFFIALGLLTSILSEPSWATSQLNIISITDSKFKGDADQIKGIERALAALAKTQKFNVKLVETDSSNIDYVHSSFQPDSQVVVISSNDYGVEALKALRKNNKKFLGVITSHQYFLGLNTAIKEAKETGITIVALPGHVMTPQTRNKFDLSSIKLVETIGIAQNLIPADCDKCFSQNSTDIIRSSDPQTKYLLVLLGGDTQNTDGKTWSYYSVEDAQKLAKFVATRAKRDNLKILITNGPRTGKFNPLTGQETKAHQNGIVDLITQKFIETLKDEQLADTQFQLFDFQFDKSSDFNRLIGAVRAHPGSQAFIDGGSTSVVCQAIVNLSGKVPVAVYQHKAMGTPHNKHVKQEYDAGRVALLKENMTFMPPKNKSEVQAKPAEELVAEEIMQEISKSTT